MDLVPRSVPRWTRRLVGLALLLPALASGDGATVPPTTSAPPVQSAAGAPSAAAPAAPTAAPVGAAPAGTPAAATVVLDSLGEAIRELTDHLRHQAGQNLGDHALRGERVVLGDVVARYYESQQFQPRWRDPARLDRLLQSVLDLANDGLDPADYHFTALDELRGEMRRRPRLPDGEQAALEVLATDSLMLALYHLYLGKVDPEKLSPQWNFASRPVDVERGFQALTRALESGQIRETFERARPQHVWYQRGRERLKEYRALAAVGGWPAVPDGPVLKPGMQDPRVATLSLRLQTTRDLEPGTPSPAEDLYDPTLEAAVRRFQQRHGLTADGVIGPATRAALNVPVEQRVDQIRINLERARWVMHEIRGEFVLVDVAGFEAAYFRNDEPVWTSRVIVGRPYRETPIFRSTITYVVLNPTWTIPPGILVKDKLPVIKRDPGYLKRNNIRVIDARPGEDNALGLVKIMFPNPYLVYLHDTPSKSLFDKDERTFSSGCIRVQKAFELAELVLNDPARWNPQTLAAAVATKKMQTVTLAQPVPVLILYWTAQPLPDGQVMFRNDVYGRDPPTLAALDGPFRPRR